MAVHSYSRFNRCRARTRAGTLQNIDGSGGLAAAWGAARFSRNGSQLAEWARRAPYLSGALMVLVGGVMGVQSALRIAAG